MEPLEPKEIEMEKLILGIISTIITPIVLYNYYKTKKKYSKKEDHTHAGLERQLIFAVFTFFMGIYLLYEYFSG